MDLEDDDSIRTCQHIKRVLFVLGRYPLFTRRYIRDNIDKSDTKPSELSDYKSNSVDSKLCLACLLVSVYMWNSVKNLYIVYLWLKAFNYTDHVDNLKELTYSDAQLARMNYSLARETLTHVSCLITNCTRLGPSEGRPESRIYGQLLDDVSLLPIFMMCNPKVDSLYYTPITRLDAFGILAFVVTMYTHFLLGTWPTIQQMFMPAHNDMIMFISSPQVSRRVIVKRCRELLQDVVHSYHNFCFTLLSESCANRALPSTSILHSLAEDPNKNWPNISLPKTRLEELAKNQMHKSGKSRDEELETTVSKCIPIVYTQWWRTRAARIMLNTFRLCLLFVAETGSAAVLLVQHRLNLRARLLEQFDQEMRQANCFIWPETTHSLDANTAFRLAEVDIHWTLFAIFNAGALSVLAGCTILTMFSLLWMELSSINLWVAEMRAFLVAGLLATRQEHLHELHRAECALGPEVERPCFGLIPAKESMMNARRFFDMANLREHFQKSVDTFVCILYRRVAADSNEQGKQAARYTLNSKRNDRHHEQSFSAQMFTREGFESESGGEMIATEALRRESNYNIETLEQIYVNLRLLVEYIRGLRTATSLIVVVSYLLNYGYLLLAIVCWRKFAISYVDTHFLVFFAFTMSSSLIFICASFHANAKQLQPLLYSLLARLALSRNLRVQHVRSLLTRQTVMLDNEGGLALSTYGFRITYVYIIQLVIETATVIVLGLKPHA